MTVSNQSRAAVFSGEAGKLTFQAFPTPEPSKGQVLVRVLGTTLCGSDLHSLHGRRTVPTPTILGHEIVGEIVSIGGSAGPLDLTGAELHVGDRVTWSIVASCNECFFCHHDLPQKCERMIKYGHEPIRPNLALLGGLAEHCLLVAGTSIVKVPAELDLAVCCPASCATATIAAAVEAAGNVSDRTVVILGAGMLGLTAAALCRLRHSANVVVTELHEVRRQHAMTFGATHNVAPNELRAVVLELTNGRGADAVIECTGSPDAMENAWPLIRIGGRLVLVGSVFPSRPVPLLLEQTVRRNLTIVGVHNYAPRHLLLGVEFLAERKFPFESLVKRWFSLNEVSQAIEFASDPSALRIGVRL